MIANQMPLNQQSFYTNSGNSGIIEFIDESDRKILDIGCGAGDTGRLIRSVYPDTEVVGITCSESEYDRASQNLSHCICINIEQDALPDKYEKVFDVLIFSHVLEHLLDPNKVITKLLLYLKPGGKVVIAIPNIANWRERWKVALGEFEYTDDGVMDKTHLHFYTFHTATKYLIDPIKELRIEHHLVNGSVPLAFFRHYLFTTAIKQFFDQLGCKYMPNLFGGEILIIAKYLPNS
jgi:2-polyprenyl-3-methyl-5-hydroxy-6-metoxy-1,4-benzoquinol methylase